MPVLHAQLACWCVWRVRFQHAQRHGRGAEQVFVSVCVHVCLQGGVCAWGTCHPESWVAVSLLHEVGMMGQFPFPSVGARRAPGSLSATLTCPVTSASFVGTERQGKDTVTLTCLVLSPSIVPPPSTLLCSRTRPLAQTGGLRHLREDCTRPELSRQTTWVQVQLPGWVLAESLLLCLKADPAPAVQFILHSSPTGTV